MSDTPTLLAADLAEISAQMALAEVDVSALEVALDEAGGSAALPLEALAELEITLAGMLAEFHATLADDVAPELAAILVAMPEEATDSTTRMGGITDGLAIREDGHEERSDALMHELQALVDAAGEAEAEARRDLISLTKHTDALRAGAAEQAAHFLIDQAAAASTAIANAEASLAVEWRAWIAAAREETPPMLLRATQEAHATLDMAVRHSIEELANLSMRLEGIGAQALSALDEALRRELGESWQRLGDQMLACVRDRLQSEFGDLVLTMQLGQAVTSALSPMLPELIAIHKAVDALKHAIDLWKTLSGGGLF